MNWLSQNWMWIALAVGIAWWLVRGGLAGHGGLTVSTAMPRTVYELMDMYPQGAGRRPSVLYTPVRMPPELRGPDSRSPEKKP